jgi:hypothetical protein
VNTYTLPGFSIARSARRDRRAGRSIIAGHDEIEARVGEGQPFEFWLTTRSDLRAERQVGPVG